MLPFNTFSWAEILKVSGGRSSSRINLHVGYESFLKKTMSEKSLITKYEFINKLYVTCWGDWERQGGGWSALWKYSGGVLGQRFSMRH